MNAKDLHKIIQMAKDAVKDEEEPFKTEGYKIILAKLMDSANKNTGAKPTTLQTSEESNETHNFESLAAKCDLSLKEIKDIFEIKNGGIEIIAPIKGSDAQKHVKITKTLNIRVKSTAQFISGTLKSIETLHHVTRAIYHSDFYLNMHLLVAI